MRTKFIWRVSTRVEFVMRNAIAVIYSHFMQFVSSHTFAHFNVILQRNDNLRSSHTSRLPHEYLISKLVAKCKIIRKYYSALRLHLRLICILDLSEYVSSA